MSILLGPSGGVPSEGPPDPETKPTSAPATSASTEVQTKSVNPISGFSSPDSNEPFGIPKAGFYVIIAIAGALIIGIIIAVIVVLIKRKKKIQVEAMDNEDYYQENQNRGVTVLVPSIYNNGQEED